MPICRYVAATLKEDFNLSFTCTCSMKFIIVSSSAQKWLEQQIFLKVSSRISFTERMGCNPCQNWQALEILAWQSPPNKPPLENVKIFKNDNQVHQNIRGVLCAGDTNRDILARVYKINGHTHEKLLFNGPNFALKLALSYLLPTGAFCKVWKHQFVVY